MGEPSKVLMAAKLPADGDDDGRGGRCVRLGQLHGEDAEPAPDGDQRRLGTEDDAEGQGGEGGQDDPGQLDRRRRSRRP